MKGHILNKVELRLRSMEHGALSVMMDLMTRMLQLSVQCLDLVGNTLSFTTKYPNLAWFLKYILIKDA